MEVFIKIPKFFLTITGYWPRPNVRYPWIYNLRLLFTIYVLSYLYIFTLTYDLYVNIDNPDILVSGSYYCITIFTYNVKFLIFTFKRQRFISLLNDLNNPLFNSKNPEYEKYTKTWSLLTNRYGLAYSISCLLCWVMYTFFPFFNMKNGIMLPTRGWFPYDPKSSALIFIFTYIFQACGQLIAIIVNVSLDLLPSVFMNISCAQIEMLKEEISNAIHYAEGKTNKKQNDQTTKHELSSYEPVSEEEEKIILVVLKECVVFHKFILSFLDEINGTFSMILFTQILASGFCLCITGLHLIVMNATKLEKLNVALYLVAMTMQFSLYCLNGHLVIEQTSSIGDSCYNMDWYRCSKQIQKHLFIIMERCKRPTKLSAGFFFIISIETMTAVIRSSYSYFAVLRRIYGK